MKKRKPIGPSAPEVGTHVSWTTREPDGRCHYGLVHYYANNHHHVTLGAALKDGVTSLTSYEDVNSCGLPLHGCLPRNVVVEIGQALAVIVGAGGEVPPTLWDW